MALTKIDIAEKIQNQMEYTKKESLDLLESVICIMKQTLGSGDDVKISGFGKFVVKQKKDRRGRNPQTSESLTIEARRILTFKPSYLLRNAINS